MPMPQRLVAVVDDDPAMLKSLERLLKAHGFETMAFASAESFLGCTAASQASCLVLDVHLPGLSGIDLRRQLTATGSKLPIIFITAVDDDATHAQAIETGCIACL